MLKRATGPSVATQLFSRATITSGLRKACPQCYIRVSITQTQVSQASALSHRDSKVPYKHFLRDPRPLICCDWSYPGAKKKKLRKKKKNKKVVCWSQCFPKWQFHWETARCQLISPGGRLGFWVFSSCSDRSLFSIFEQTSPSKRVEVCFFATTRRSRRPISSLQSSVCLLVSSRREIHRTREDPRAAQRLRRQGLEKQGLATPVHFAWAVSCVLTPF